MAEELPVFEFDWDESDPMVGVVGMSIVDEPAIESNFVAYSKDTGVAQTKTYAIPGAGFVAHVDNERQMVTGPVMIPDKLIYRTGTEDTPEHYQRIRKHHIQRLQEKFHREDRHRNLNLMHDNSLANYGHMSESWIISDSKKDKAAALGMELPVGTWMFSVKVSNEHVWAAIKKGRLRGFSMEGFFQLKTTGDVAPTPQIEHNMDTQLKQKQTLLSQIAQALGLSKQAHEYNDDEKSTKMMSEVMISTPDGGSATLTFDESMMMPAFDSEGNEIGTITFEPTASQDENAADTTEDVTSPSAVAAENSADKKRAALVAENHALRAKLQELQHQSADNFAGLTDFKNHTQGENKQDPYKVALQRRQQRKREQKNNRK